MKQTIISYVIKTEANLFLSFEQESEKDIYTWETPNVIEATQFETEGAAQKEIQHIFDSQLKNYYFNFYGNFSKPVKQVKVTINVEVEE